MFQAMLDHEFHQCEISVFEIGQGSIHNLVMGSYDGLYLVVINIVSGYFHGESEWLLIINCFCGYFHGEPEWLFSCNGFCGYVHGESEWLLIING